MSNFTKQELEEILGRFQDNHGRLSIEQVFNLVIKIKSMIDSCCDHESDGKKWKRPMIKDEEPWLMCKDCGELYR